METVTIGKALNLGLRRALEDDPKVILMGEDIGKLGGVFRITDGLQKDFGDDRVIDTPLAESGIVGTAVGLCFRGYRPVIRMAKNATMPSTQNAAHSTMSTSTCGTRSSHFTSHNPRDTGVSSTARTRTG